MNALLWLIKKELWRFGSDFNGAVMTVLLPVVLASFMGIIFAPSEGADRIELLVVDKDGGERVRSLVAAIDEDGVLRVEELDEGEARRRVESGDSSLALIIPEGANELLKPGALFGSTGKLETELLFDPSHGTEADLAAGLVTKVLMQQLTIGFTDPTMMRGMFSDMRAAIDVPGTGSSSNRAAWLAFTDAGLGLADELPPPAETERSTGLEPPLELKKKELTAAGPASGYNSYAHNFAGMLCMFLFFMAQQMAANLLAEKREGALDRVRLSLASPTQILVACGIGTSIVAIVSAALVYLVGMLVFKIAVLGSWLAFFANLTALSILVGGFSLLLAGVGRTEKQLSTFGTFAILIMSFAGGAMIPSFVMPEWLQYLGRLFPTYWVTDGLAAATWRGLPLLDALLSAGIVMAFGLLFAAIGIRSFRWED